MIFVCTDDKCFQTFMDIEFEDTLKELLESKEQQNPLLSKDHEATQQHVYGTERSLLHESIIRRKERPSSSAWQSEGFVIPNST